MLKKTHFLLSSLAIISMLAFVQCSSSEKVPKSKAKKEDLPDIQVLSAYATTWVAGTKNGGAGTNYRLDLIVNKNNIKFDHLCATQIWLDLRILKSNNIQPTGYRAMKGDTLSLRASFKSVELVAMCNDSLKVNEFMLHYIESDSLKLKLKIENVVLKEAEPRP